jgi:hypothetical protein
LLVLNWHRGEAAFVHRDGGRPVSFLIEDHGFTGPEIDRPWDRIPAVARAGGLSRRTWSGR